MSSDTVISVENLGKRYRIGLAEKRARNLREALQRAAGAPFRYLRSRLRETSEEEILWALRNISFEVRQGEVLGIIGRNGAGKSTLLKILSRITDPTEGRAWIKGRVNSLLEVGSGFHPELTGRENIYMNAALHGMKRAEINRKLDEIIAFAEIEKFIDTPVKRYSSGMYTRLAFAVAAHLEPDILIVDEVLAVGDFEFRKKCVDKMGGVALEGKTVLLVSHNMRTVNRLCSNCVLLSKGRIVASGPPAEVVTQYLVAGTRDAPTEAVLVENPSKICQLLSARICHKNGETVARQIEVSEPFAVELTAVIRRRIAGGYAVVFLQNEHGEIVFLSDSRDRQESAEFESEGRRHIRVAFPAPLLVPGKYHVSIGLAQAPHGGLDRNHDILTFEIVDIRGVRERREGHINVPLIWEDCGSTRSFVSQDRC
ncbi:MAG: ABC transporter ATP-binding protein [Phycisphaerae bacterium]|nr:ABC transporter ATP-binding protein [Phycisphaerae bacterium]